MRSPSGRAATPRCGAATCVACRLYERLTEQGAEPTAGSAVRDDACSVDIRFSPEHRCIGRLRLDVPAARYRRERGAGRTSRMCDFAAGAMRAEEFRILVIELKAGAADRAAIDQLQAGLDLIAGELDGPLRNVRPHAHLVADKQNAQLKNLLRSSKRRLRFGSLTLDVQVRGCGGELDVGNEPATTHRRRRRPNARR